MTTTMIMEKVERVTTRAARDTREDTIQASPERARGTEVTMERVARRANTAAKMERRARKVQRPW